MLEIALKNHEVSEVKIYLIEKLLNIISQEYCDMYDSWYKIGYAIFNAYCGDVNGLELWKEWSKKSQK